MADHSPRSDTIDLGIPGYTEAFEIGRGGFGVVYRARQPDLDRTVAIKVLLSGRLDELARARFDRERQITGKLSDHPHIVTVFGSGFTPGGGPYIVMAYMTRGSLADRVDLEGPLGWREAAVVGVKLCRALEAAHQAKVLHRDIKPENVFVSAYGEPALGDFGIARIEGGMRTSDGLVTATVAHAPPEILSGGTPTVASDVYGLGSTLFTLISGNSPYFRAGEEWVPPMMARIADDPVPDLRPRGVPDSLCRVLERAMAKAPAERQPSAAKLGQELRRAIEQHASTRETVNAAPSPVLPRASRVGGDPDDGAATAHDREHDARAEPDDRIARSVPDAPQPSDRFPDVPPKRRRRWPLIVGAVVLALVGAGLWALMAMDDQAAVTSNPTSTPSSGATLAPPPQQQGSSPAGALVGAGRAIYQVAQSRSSEIFVINLDTGERQRVETELVTPRQPSADATGERLAVTSELDSGSVVALRRSATEEFVVLPLPGDAHTPALSPDGSQMAFVSDAGGQDDIYVVDLSSLEVERVTDSSSPEFDPAWEPTGERLAFVRQGSGGDVIVVVRPDGSVEATIATPGRKSSPAWSPAPVDGLSQIAFIGEVSGQRQPQTVDAATGKITSSFAVSSTPLGLTWMADLRLLVALSDEGLVLIGTDGGVERVDATRGAAAPRWFGEPASS